MSDPYPRHGRYGKLGRRQVEVLRSLVRHGFWARWFCGWVWTTPRETERICDSLVSRGLAEMVPMANDEEKQKYVATTEGRRIVDEADR